ncbi:CD82 antigen-like [Echeneis naucrates]|uniref:CD82 antigen-like n=1 Tax=Echeneis naucrates TaxID=173247 RepID=UPI0011142305|nr:CD82 antigen-like [Echeneis naucrates]
MKLDLKIQLLKFCSAVFNIVFLALGLSVSGCGIWILYDKGNFLSVLSSVELRTVAFGLLIIGGVVAAVSVVGFIGANGENRFLLLTYLVFLLVLVLGQIFITLLLLFSRYKIEQGLDAVLEQIILQYGGSSLRKDSLMDQVQHQARCCGRTGPSDWLNNPFIQSLNLTGPTVLPCSCFRSTQTRFNSSWCSDLNQIGPTFFQGNGSYQEGCKHTLSVWLQENIVIIVSMDFSLVLLQVIQCAVMVKLFQAFGRKVSLLKSNQLADPGPTHLDHTPTEDADYREQIYTDPDTDSCYGNVSRN